jgi:uncharacterized protein YggT (Ycf19 family)
MDFSGLDNLFNLLIAAFWFGAWGMDSRYAYFNSYLRPMHNKFEAMFAFLRPAFLNASGRVIAMVLVAALLLLRSLIVPHNATWNVTLGVPQVVGLAQPFRSDSWTMILAWGCISTGVFFFKFWSLSCLYLGFTRRPEGQVQTALHALTAPFSWIHPVARPPVLFAFGIGLGVLLQTIGSGLPFSLVSDAKALFAVVASWVALIDLLRWAVFVVIVGHWIGMGTGSQNLGWMCSEWLDHLLGPLRHYPIRIGIVDVTPLIFFFGLGLVQSILLQILVNAASLLP